MVDITKEKFSETASKEEFGRLAAAFRADKLDFYGRGFNEISCKEDGLRDYMFSVGIENTRYKEAKKPIKLCNKNFKRAEIPADDSSLIFFKSS